MKRFLLPMAAVLLLCAGCTSTSSQSPQASASMASTGRLEMTAVASTGALELTSERLPDPVPAP